MKILRHYIIKEILTSCFAVLLILWAVLMTARLAHFLGAVAEGRIPADVLFELLALKSIGYVVALFPVSVFVGSLLAIGRLYRDSEMAVMYACGFQPKHIYGAMISLAIPTSLVVLLLSAWVSPWSENQAALLKKNAASSAIFRNLNEGRFNTFGRNDAMLYVERMSDDKQTLHNVVYKTERDEKFVLLSAPKAYHLTDDTSGDHYLSLEDGFRYEGVAGQGDWLIGKFKRHGIVLQEPEFDGKVTKTKALSFVDLLVNEPKKQAELHRRISFPIAIILMALLAVALGRSRPREGKYGRLFLGIMIYVVYANLLTVGESWISRGRLPANVGLWWAHGLVLMLWWFAHKQAFGRFRIKRSKA